MIRLRLSPFQKPADGAGGGGQTPEEKAAADAAAATAAAAAEAEKNKGKTPEQIAAEAAEAEKNKGKTPEQLETERKDAERLALANAGAPAKYELKLPEGGHVDAADMAVLEAHARKENWTNLEAQAALEEHETARAALSSKFLAETTAHAEVGGDKLPITQARVEKVLDRFLPKGTPEGDRFRSEITKIGYGNWLPWVILVSRVGEAMGDDKLAAGRSGAGGGGGDRKSNADVLFGDAKK